MLTEKDYCDYDTCVALRELGLPFDWHEDETCHENNTNILLYEAQKWLREEKEMFVTPMLFADNLIDEDGRIVNRWLYYAYSIISTSTAEFIRNYDQSEEYDSYTSALHEGIKEAVKLLKEEK